MDILHHPSRFSRRNMAGHEKSQDYTASIRVFLDMCRVSDNTVVFLPSALACMDFPHILYVF